MYCTLLVGVSGKYDVLPPSWLVVQACASSINASCRTRIPRFGGRRGPQRGEDVVYELGCTLEQFYNGATRKLKMNKTEVCAGCDGEGGANVKTCSDCGGRV